MDSKPIHHPSSQKNEMLIFVLRSTSDDRRGWLMDSNRIHYPSPAKKWNAHFCITFNFWWLARLVIGLEPHPPPVSSQKKWNAHLWITFNFWWSAGLVDELESHLAPLSSQKNEVLIFGLCSTSDDRRGWLMDSNCIHYPSPAKKWNAHFCITFNFWWLARLVNGLKPHPPPISSQRMKCSFLDYIQLLMIGRAGRWTQTSSTTPLQQENEMLIFGLRSTSDDWPGWSMDSNPICHPSPTKKMKCLFLYYVQLLMIGGAGRWTWTASITLLQPKKWNAHFCITFNFWWLAKLVIGLEPHPPPLSSQKKWNAHFWITFNFWWSARLVDGLECHPPPLSSQRMKCSFLDYVQLLMIGQVGQRTQTPSATSLKPKIWNACFWITFNLWWSARLVKGLKPHLQPLSNQQNEMLILVLCSTSVDQPGWLMDSNPICHPSQAKKMKCSFLYYIQLLMIGQAGHWTQTPSTWPLKPKKNEMLIFGLHLTSDDHPSWLMDSNPICNLSPGIKWNSHFCITFNFWWSAGLVDGLEPHPPPLSSQKNEMLVFGLCSTSDDWPGWSMDLNPICYPSPAKKWNAHFWITFNFGWSARLVDGLEPHLPPLSNHKNDMLIFVLCSTSYDWPGWSMDSNPICNTSPTRKINAHIWITFNFWSTRTASTTLLQPKKWNAHFRITFNFWWLAGLVDGLEPHPPPVSSQKKWNAHFWITFNFWWLAGLVDELE